MNTESPITQSSTTSTRRKGNVARLPKPLRDLVNSMLEDGATYPEIVAALEKSTNPPLPHPVSVNNLSNWFEGGYKDYLRDQAWRERITTQSDRYLEIATDDPTKLVAGGLYAAVVHVCDIMDELSQAKSGETDADKVARMSHALSRISRSVLTIQQYREKVAKETAAELKLRDPNKPFGGEDDYRAVVKVVDRVLGFDRFRAKHGIPDYMPSVGTAAYRVKRSANPSLEPNDAVAVPSAQAESQTAPATNAHAEPVQQTGDVPPTNCVDIEFSDRELTLTEKIAKDEAERAKRSLTEIIESGQVC